VNDNFRNGMKDLDVEKVEIHPIADLHRNHSEAEFNALKEGIRLNGQITPAIMYRGKLVDGRHRLKALKELGMDKIKVIELKNNLTLPEVEEVVIDSENRRTDTPAQKAIRALKWKRAHGGSTKDAGLKFGVNRSDVSMADSVFTRLGEDIMNKMYLHGRVMLGGKRYSTIRSLYNALKESDRAIERNSELKMIDEVKDIVNRIKSISERDDGAVHITQIITISKKILDEKLS